MELLRRSPPNFDWTPVKIAIVTGLSDPRSTVLHESQIQFLHSLPVSENWKVPYNFPFVVTQPPSRWPDVVSASIHNFRQFINCRRKDCQRASEKFWQAILDSTDELLLITGSCGLEVVNQIPISLVANTRVEVLAFGPVSLKPDKFPVTTIRGKRDWISGLFRKQCNHYLNGIGHMDYWCDHQVRDIARNWLLSRTSESSAQEVTFPAGN